MPRKRQYKKKPRQARNLQKTRKYYKRQVAPFPKQIQSATYIPKNRLVKFMDFRSFVVTDDGGSMTTSYPPLLQVGLNDPTQFIESTQGTWTSNNLGAKGNGVPAISKWLTNKIPGTTSTADYLTGSCLGCKLDITVYPLPPAEADVANYQKTAKVVLANQTRFGHLKNRGIDTNLNAERVSEMPMVRSSNIYLNTGGTPKGCSLSLKYSFKKNNANQGKLSENLFYADTSPLERDVGALIILPGDSNSYGTGGRVFDCRVEVRVSYIVLLSEVNTHIGQSINDGNYLSHPATAAA